MEVALQRLSTIAVTVSYAVFGKVITALLWGLSLACLSTKSISLCMLVFSLRAKGQVC